MYPSVMTYLQWREEIKRFSSCAWKISCTLDWRSFSSFLSGATEHDLRACTDTKLCIIKVTLLANDRFSFTCCIINVFFLFFVDK